MLRLRFLMVTALSLGACTQAGPREVALQATKALLRRDVQGTTRLMYIKNEGESRAVEAELRLIMAQMDWNAAVDDCFGKDAGRVRRSGWLYPDFKISENDLRTAQESIKNGQLRRLGNGRMGIWTPRSNETEPFMELQQVSGQWKVVYEDFRLQDAGKMEKECLALAECYEAFTRRVKAGEFSSADEAHRAWEKVMVAMDRRNAR